MRNTRIIANSIALPAYILLFTLMGNPAQWVRTLAFIITIIITIPLLLLNFGDLYASLPDETGKPRTITSTRH